MKYVLLALLFGACSNTKNDLVEEPYTPTCPQTAFFGTTDPPQPEDLRQAEISKKRCKELYGPKSCLISLTRKAERVYHASCGNRL